MTKKHKKPGQDSHAERFAVFTSATTTYLDRAAVLVESLRRFHKNADVYIVFPDVPPPDSTAGEALSLFDGVITLQDLHLDENKGWIFSHDIVEFCTAVKPFALQHLLNKQYRTVVYLDPDIAVFSPLDWVLNQMQASSIALTPHQLAPEQAQQAIVDNELCALQYGIYNLGFAAVRNDTNGRLFAQWWADRCTDYCIDDPAHGLFTDQKMCDLVPALFDDVKVLRHPGLNVASWNLSHRKLSTTADGAIVVADKDPLVFFHFTKINHVGEAMILRYSSGSTLPLELMMWYRNQLKRHAIARMPERYWQFGAFADGTVIERAHRRRYRNDPRLRSRCDNPFTFTQTEFLTMCDAL